MAAVLRSQSHFCEAAAPVVLASCPTGRDVGAVRSSLAPIRIEVHRQSVCTVAVRSSSADCRLGSPVADFCGRLLLPSQQQSTVVEQRRRQSVGESSSRRNYRTASTRAMAGEGGGDGDPIRDWICSPEGGGATKITGTSPVFGGCINSAYCYTTDNGKFFVKINRSADAGMFEAEMKGLQAMYDTHTIRVPQPFKAGALPRRGSYIIMEFIEFGSGRGGQRELGRQLGLMHKQGASANGFGFGVDNTIGSTPQVNPWTPDWPTFFRDHRLKFQMDLIRKRFYDPDISRLGEKLLDRIPSLFEGVEVTPCLLHGDLWSGNIANDATGAPVILDPATYYGHSEAEFGMSWCASFGRDFYDAYFEIVPKQPGFEERVELYKLYHYLNHYNLFGSSYESSCMSILQRFA